MEILTWPTFDPLLHPKTHFWTHFSPLTKTHLKPTLRGNKAFSKKRALRQPRHFFTLFGTFPHFFRFFPPGLFLELRVFTTVLALRDEKRPKENNKKKKTKPFCTLVVARLSSSDLVDLGLGENFGPEKKKLAPPPPIHCRHPPGPPPPPRPGELPQPPGIFNLKTHPPSPCRPVPSPEQKKIEKYPKRPPSQEKIVLIKKG